MPRAGECREVRYWSGGLWPRFELVTGRATKQASYPLARQTNTYPENYFRR